MSKHNGKDKKNKAGWKVAPRSVRVGGLSSIRDDLCQILLYPPELRIERPRASNKSRHPVSAQAKKSQRGTEPAREERQHETPLLALAEVATCLWYIKTKHFKREWHNEDTTDDDPRTRRTLGRLNKGADSLKKCGLEVADPTGKRYPTGCEAMMRPLDFFPTEGLTYEKVTEVVRPLVYLNGQLIQRAEVFVAVPMASAVERDTPPKKTDDSHSRTQGGATAPSDHPPAPQCPCEERSPQKPESAIGATNNTASAETGEQA